MIRILQAKRRNNVLQRCKKYIPFSRNNNFSDNSINGGALSPNKIYVNQHITRVTKYRRSL